MERGGLVVGERTHCVIDGEGDVPRDDEGRSCWRRWRSRISITRSFRVTRITGEFVYSSVVGLTCEGLDDYEKCHVQEATPLRGRDGEEEFLGYAVTFGGDSCSGFGGGGGDLGGHFKWFCVRCWKFWGEGGEGRGGDVTLLLVEVSKWDGWK